MNAAAALIRRSCAVAHNTRTSVPAQRHPIVPSAHGPVRTVWSLAVVAGHCGSIAGIREGSVVWHVAVVEEIRIDLSVIFSYRHFPFPHQ
jgi:hypothetical protein